MTARLAKRMCRDPRPQLRRRGPWRAGLAAIVAAATLIAPPTGDAQPVGGRLVYAGFKVGLAFDERAGIFLVAETGEDADGLYQYFDASGPRAGLRGPFGARDAGGISDVDVAADPTRGEELIVFAQWVSEGSYSVGGAIVSPSGSRDVFAVPARGEGSRGVDVAVAFDRSAQVYFVVWSDAGAIRGRRVSAEGRLLGTTSRVSDRSASGNHSPDVVHKPGIGWLVVWQSSRSDGTSDVVGQAVTATGSDTGSDDFRISYHENLGGRAENKAPSVAYNPARREALVVWSDRYEIFAQRLSSSNGRLGAGARLSTMGPDGDPAYRARGASVAYHPRAAEYLVAWVGNDSGPSEPWEVFGQHVSATGKHRGTDDFRVLSHAEGGFFCCTDQVDTAVVADPRSREYMVAGGYVRRVVAPA
jgi:hypothetical protein